MKIEITCGYQRLEKIDELEYFQGDLKELRKSEAEKLKKSIFKYGFTAPVFVWENKILDGHQRLFVVRQMLSEGYSLEGVPVVEIMADSEKQAAEKLLAITSRYAKMTDEGLYAFVSEHDLDVADVSDFVDFPEIDMGVFRESYFEEKEESSPREKGEREKADEFFGVFVECVNEIEQKQLLEKFTAEGMKCKALTS